MSYALHLHEIEHGPAVLPGGIPEGGGACVKPIRDWPGYLAGSDGHIYSVKKSAGPRRVKATMEHRTGLLRVQLYGSHATKHTQPSGRVLCYDYAYVHVLIYDAWGEG